MEIKLSNATLFYQTYGCGRPLILLHGNGEDSRIFDGLRPYLEDDFKVFALDSRCHGKSQKGLPISYNLMREDVAEFIAKLDIENPIIFGFSDGAIIVLLLAINHPDSVGDIIAAGPNATPDGLKAKWLRVFKLGYFFTKNPLLQMMLREPNISKTELSKITAKITILGGERDMIKTDHLKHIADAAPNGRFISLSGETHGSYVLNSGKLFAIIKPLLYENV